VPIPPIELAEFSKLVRLCRLENAQSLETEELVGSLSYPFASGRGTESLVQIEIENFKGVSAKQNITLAPITLLFGLTARARTRTILRALPS
jgi:hypothetical protein